MIALLIALTIQAPVSPAQVEAVRAKAPAIRDALDMALIDYQSARFRDVVVTVNLEAPEPRTAYLCGYVNARNPLGGFTGWSAFMAMADDRGGIVNLAQPGRVDIVIDATCGRGGSHASDPTDRSAWLTPR